MAVYRFRVTFEDHDEVSRDIEIRSTQTFEDFHQAIHSFIGFDASKPASFYISNDNWKKGAEITSRDLKGSEKETIATMRKAKLADYIADPHQKIYYVFDPSVQWAFRIELIKILPAEDFTVSYPRLARQAGEAPKQYVTVNAAAIPDPEDFDETALLEDEKEEEVEVEESGIEVDEIPAALVKDEEELEGALGDSDEEPISPEEGLDEEEV